MKSIGIVIVNYRNDAETQRFIREEVSRIQLPYRLVVVDNGASEAEAKALEERIGHPVLPHANDGFAIGNNAGMAYLTARYELEYLLFTNTDIHLSGDGVVEALVRKMEEDPRIGIIGPEVVGLDGKRQSPEPYQGLWDRYVWMYLSTPFLPKEKKARRFALDYSARAEEGFHYKVMGSFFLCRTKDLAAVGGFDPHTFLYAEEPILSERMAGIGKGVYFLPSVQVVHAHGATIRSHYSQRQSALMRFDSDAYYYRTYKAYPAWSIGLARLCYRLILRLKR